MGTSGPRFTLRQVELFCAAARTGSFAAAAAEMYVTSTAVATAVDELERILGHQLLSRRRAHGVTLTPVGRHVLASASELIHLAVDLQSRLGDNGDEITGPVSIGCYPSQSADVLPAVVASFRDHHPRADLTIVDGDMAFLIDALTQGTIDIAVGYRVNLSGTITSAPLFETSVHALISRDHPLAERDSVTFDALRNEPLVLLDMPPSGDDTMTLLRAAGISPRIALRTPNFELVRSFVARGLGYSLVMHRDIDVPLDDGATTVLKPFSPPGPRENIAVMWHAGEYRAERIALGIKSMLEVDEAGRDLASISVD